MNRSTDVPVSAKLPQGIWALGFVSLFMDISSEMVHSLLPVFLVTSLGATTILVGAIEGVGEATASISKLFSGWLSDRLHKRKLLTVMGYSLGALSKPLFALAPTPYWVLGARFVDRVGKGLRGAPRDALLGDIAPPAVRGAAYGLRQSLDTVGAFLGPLAAIGLMAWFADDIRAVFSLAIIPGVVSVAILVLMVREPRRAQARGDSATPIRLDDVRRLGRLYWTIVGAGTVLTLARFSEAFLILKVQATGLPLVLVPTVLILMNVVYAASAYPVGVLSDRMERRTLLNAGIAVLILADMPLAFGESSLAVMPGVALWGLHMGMTQGLLATLVADTAPSAVRGTAFGVFNFASGIAVLLASLIAGLLWDIVGPSMTFIAGAAFAAVALIAMNMLAPPRRAAEQS